MRAFTALVNPISGDTGAAAAWAPVQRLLAGAGAAAAVVTTRSADHAQRCARDAAARGDVVVAVGGDGLIRDAAGGVVAAGGEGALSILPAGRGNDLARALRLPAAPDALAGLLLDAPVRRIDVLEVGGVVVPGNVYAGIDAVATRIINRSRWLPGLLSYRLAPARAAMGWRPPTYTVTVDGETRKVRAHTVVVANSGAYGHGLRIVPTAQLDDGRLDVLVVGAGPLTALARFMSQARTGSHVERPEVELTTGLEVTVDANRPVPLCADGDEIGHLPATIRIRPAALPLLSGMP